MGRVDSQATTELATPVGRHILRPIVFPLRSPSCRLIPSNLTPKLADFSRNLRFLYRRMRWILLSSMLPFLW